MLSLAVLAALTLSAADNAPAPVAMVLTTKGTVTLQREPDKSGPLRAMDLLRPGDQLNAGADSEATVVFLADGRRERLKAKAKATVGDKACMPAESVQKLENAPLTAANLQSLRDLAASGRAGVGVLRGENPTEPLLVTPLYGATTVTDRPLFRWPAVDKAQSYRVEVLSGDGQRVLWRATTKEPTLSYPEKEAVLRRGTKVVWRVAARLSEDKEDRVVDSKFSVATKEEADELAGLKKLADSDDPVSWLLAATTYEAHGVYGAALRLYEKLAEKFPREGNYQVALASYYERAGQPDKAKAAREKAKQLGVLGPEKP